MLYTHYLISTNNEAPYRELATNLSDENLLAFSNEHYSHFCENKEFSKAQFAIYNTPKDMTVGCINQLYLREKDTYFYLSHVYAADMSQREKILPLLPNIIATAEFETIPQQNPDLSATQIPCRADDVITLTYPDEILKQLVQASLQILLNGGHLFIISSWEDCFDLKARDLMSQIISLLPYQCRRRLNFRSYANDISDTEQGGSIIFCQPQDALHFQKLYADNSIFYFLQQKISFPKIEILPYADFAVKHHDQIPEMLIYADRKLSGKLKNDPALNITLDKNQFVEDVNNALSQLPESDRKNPSTLKDATENAGVEAVKQQLQDYANKNDLPQSMKDALNNATPNVTVDDFGNIHVDDVPVSNQIVNGFDVSLANGKNTSWINDVNLDSIKQSIWKNTSVNKFFTSDWEKAPVIVEQDLLKYINGNIDTFVTNANLIPGAPAKAIAAKVEVMNNTHRARIIVTYSNIVSFPNAFYGQNETHEYWVTLKANPKLAFSDMINSSQIKDTIAQNPDIDPNVIVHDMIIGNPVGQNGQIKDWVEANKDHLPNSYVEDILNALAKDQPSVSYHDGVIDLGDIIGSDGKVIVPAASIDLNASSGYSAMWAIFFILLLLAIILVIGKLIHDKRSYDEHNDRQRGKHLL